MTYLTEDEFRKHLQLMRQAPYLPLDTEGTLNHPFSKTWGVSTSASNYPEYFAFNHMVDKNLPSHWLPALQEVITNHPCLVMHHAKHDLRALKSLGIDYRGKFYCTMMMAHFLDENQFSKDLDFQSRLHGGEPKRNSEVQQKIIDGFGWEYIPVQFIRPYGANDAFITGELFYQLLPEFQDQGFDGELWDIEQDFIRLMAQVEDTGSLIDQDLSQRELERGLKIMSDLQKELGFNPSSTKDLKQFLVDDMGLPVVKRTKTGNPSFDKDAMKIYDELLQQTNDKRAAMVLTYRGWQKTTSSNYKPYLELLGPDGRLHPNFKLHGTVSGRMSCEKPNLQQIPRESPNDWNGHLKKAFIVEKGHTAWEFDYSQLEFRLGAAYGQEKRLIEIFSDKDRDIFNEIAKELGMVRQNVKTLVYTIQYSGGAKRISQVFGVSLPAARAILNNFYKRYPGLLKASSLATKRMEENGYVRYWTGRRRHSNNPQHDAYKAFSSLIQGGAFEIVKRKMVELHKAGLNNPECRMDLQVHDSVRFDIENGKEDIYLPEIQHIMQDVSTLGDFGVRFKVDKKKWADAA